MDRTIELASKGNLGDPEAIQELGLSAVAPIDFQDMKSVDKGTLETMMTLCEKGALAGKCLGIDLLQMSGEHVMELIQILANNEVKGKLNYHVDKDDVYKRMGVVCKERWEWLHKLGEEEDGPVNDSMTWLSQTIAYARQGDEISQNVLHMTRLPRLSLKTPTSTPPYTSLLSDFKRCAELAAFARYSGDVTLRIINQLGMAALNCLQKTAHKDEEKLVATVDGQDVSSTLLEELRNIRLWLDTVTKMKKKAEEMSDKEDDLEDTEYVPPTDDESESQRTKKRKAETPPTGKAPVPSKKMLTVAESQPSTSKQQTESASEFEEAASDPETEKQEKTEKKRKDRITKKESV